MQVGLEEMVERRWLRHAVTAAEGESPAQERRVEFNLVAKDAEMEARTGELPAELFVPGLDEPEYPNDWVQRTIQKASEAPAPAPSELLDDPDAAAITDEMVKQEMANRAPREPSVARAAPYPAAPA